MKRYPVSFFPMCGQKSVDGHLKSEGIRVSRHRIRECLKRIDPCGVERHARHALHRRKYSVRSPNDLWHIDGYHKLIRWGIVIHGGIDGHSRLTMFLQASTNNRADTMFRAFRSGISEFGLPCRVRMDKGGENVQVAQYMLERDDRGLERGSIILLLQLDVVYIIKELKDCGEIFSQVAFHSFTICFTSLKNATFFILTMLWICMHCILCLCLVNSTALGFISTWLGKSQLENRAW